MQTEPDTHLDAPAGILAELAGRFELHIGNANKRLESIDHAVRRPPAQPVMTRVSASGIFTAGALWLAPQQFSPPQGRIWYVRSVRVGGISPTTVAAGRADLYVTTQIPNAGSTQAQLGLSDWVDGAAALPAVTFYNRGAISLRDQESLVASITGGTAAQQYVAVWTLEEFEEAPMREAFAL